MRRDVPKEQEVRIELLRFVTYRFGIFQDPLTVLDQQLFGS